MGAFRVLPLVAVDNCRYTAGSVTSNSSISSKYLDTTASLQVG